jgi:hypothetical protein
MKKHALTLVGVLSLLLAAGSAWTQISAPALRAHIPFNFVVDKQALPAGEYTIAPMGTGGNALLIRDRDGKAKALVVTNNCESLNPADKSKLVFRRYGTDRYFLSQVWVAGNDTGRQLPKSAHESEVAMDLHSTDVIVLASLR